MPVEMIGLIVIAAMFILIFFRVPIAISMILPSLIAVYVIRGWEPLSTTLYSIVWDHTANYELSTIPTFVLMGELLFISGISHELFDSIRKWIGGLRGGLGMATIGASALFAAVTGSSLATAGTMGPVALKEMISSGYNKSFSSGSVAAGATLGILIPPSTTFIVYGIITESSIGDLFLAGILPGITLAFLYMATIYISVIFKPQLAPLARKSPWKEKWLSLRPLAWILALFILVIGGIYTGVFSPTEAGGVGAFGAFLIASIRKKITTKTLFQALVRTLKVTSFIFAIIVGAFILNYVLVLTNVTTILTELLLSTGLSTLGIIILILLMYFILGAVMDALAMVVITMPIILPTLISLDINLIWFGVLVVICVEVALITPPMGMICFVLNGVSKEVNLGDIFKGVIRFLIPVVVLVALLIAFPEFPLLLIK